jgi:hypothetical protein
MNHYDARQKRGPDGEVVGWHYTCRNDGRIWAVGDCRDHGPHATQLEAYECYTAYLLRERLRLDHVDISTQHKCTECGTWTSCFASVDDSGYWPLCDDHRTATVVAKLLGTVGASISSW